MKWSLKFVVAMFLLTVPFAAWADRGESQKTPTFDNLKEGYCFTHEIIKSKFHGVIGTFQIVSKSYCDMENGVLFHKDDCAERHKYDNAFCLRIKENDNFEKLYVKYLEVGRVAEAKIKIEHERQNIIAGKKLLEQYGCCTDYKKIMQNLWGNYRNFCAKDRFIISRQSLGWNLDCKNYFRAKIVSRCECCRGGKIGRPCLGKET
jgi:hypothetical protein